MVETRFDKIVVRSKLPTPFASAEAFGAGAGRALQRTGAVMANVADKALVKIDRQKQKDAVNKGMQFENSFDKLRREKVNSDYLTRKGQAALGTKNGIISKKSWLPTIMTRKFWMKSTAAATEPRSTR